jgi:hypothetical protein
LDWVEEVASTGCTKAPITAVVAKVMAKVTANVNVLASDFRSSVVVVTIIASAFVVVIEFVVFALLLAIFLANDISVSMIMLILCISLKIMQIHSVGL